MASDETGVDASQRTKGVTALGRRSFGESQYLRQVGVNTLRDIISGENDDAREGSAGASKTSDRAADKSSDSKTSLPEEKKPQAGVKDGGDSATTSSGSTLMPPPPPADVTSDATSMNVQLWELEEKRPVGVEEGRTAGGCDTSRPPSEENQVATTHGGSPPPFSRDALTKILTARHMLDKRSLLEYSLCKGKAGHFEDLACWIRWKLGVGGLVSQLREPGVNGAPLLFQAVTTPACFEAAKKEIKDTLGVGGLTQQVRATDQQGMNLLMHAARYANSVEVFSSALELVKVLTKREAVKGLTDQENGVSQLRHWDVNGMNLLHHGAEGCAEEMLSKVIDVIEDLRILNGTGEKVKLLHHLTTQNDRGAPSPDLCALARQWTPNSMLGDQGVGRMEIRRDATRAFDEFKCAARGGKEAFEFVCQRQDRGRETGGCLRAALGLEPYSALTDTEKRYTELLAHAALGGDEAVLGEVTKALCDNGVLQDELARKSDYPINESDFFRPVRQARSAGSLEENTGSGSVGGGDRGLKASLFALTVLSGKTEAVDWAADFVTQSVTDHEQAWSALSGWPLAFAVAVSGFGKGRCVFEAVCEALRKAAMNKCENDLEAANTLFRKELVGDQPSKSRFSPFAVAAFSETAIMVDKIGDAYKQGASDSPGGSEESEGLKKIKTSDVIAHVGAVLSMKKDRARAKAVGADAEVKTGPKPTPEVTLLLRSCRGTGALRGLLEAVKDKEFRKGVESAELQHSLSKAMLAASDGSFEGLRAFIEKGWDCHEILRTLIKKIGDYEESVIDIVLCAIKNATNPFVTAAIASSEIHDRHRYTPRDRNGLANLQDAIDALTAEILDKLPQTVRGMGYELASSYLDNNRYSGRGKAVMANLAGYIAVRWMLEPSLHEGPKDNEIPSDRDINPLEQALSRGSAACAFINSPLVLDYMELKWTCTVPSWSSRNPFDHAINEGFYTYGSNESGSSLGGTLLRILQGWDLGRPVPSLRLPQKEGPKEGEAMKQGQEEQQVGTQNKNGASFFLRGFPRTTVLPGLQFILAGIIGKPDQFFLIPFVRFFFETSSYLIMLCLYCSCVSIETSSEIPANEILFYIFVAGLTWREVMEFRDALPPLEAYGGEEEGARDKSGRSQHRATSAIRGYFATDNWNILDTASILCVLVAFIFRLIAYAKDLYTGDNIFNNAFTQQAFFIARFSLAAIAPLLFARVLSLAQVDNVLGPMTQIIWAMLFHLFRFSIFMLVVMASFAVAFHSLFSHPNCLPGDDLYDTFKTLDGSLLRMFEAMLGDPGFDSFESTRNESCTGPAWEFDAGIVLLVAYMLIMAILMLNLLIAVLSAAHDAVIENAITEFHLGRSQTIQASAYVIEKSRLPPPLNILMGIIWVGVDLVGEIFHQFGCFASSPDDQNGSTGNNSPGGGGGGADVGGDEAAPAFAVDGEVENTGSKDLPVADGVVGNATDSFKPLSQQQEALALGGALERLLFACTMGLVALALNAALWVVSILSLTGRIVRWMSMAAEKKRCRPSQAAGYFRQLYTGMLGLLAFIVGLFVAALFCSFCIASSIAVWFRGVYGLLEWYTDAKPSLAKQRDRSKTKPLSSFGKGAVMPGALGADKEVWQDAAGTVEGTNFGPTERKKEELRGFGQDVPRRFDVGALLNMTTGWSLSHLSALVTRKDKESRKEEAMLREIDEEKRRRGKARRREEAKHRDEARKFTLG